MKESNNSDQELEQFFKALKSEEAQQPFPGFEKMLGKVPGSKKSTPLWRYAAAVALLIIGFGTYQWGYNSQESPIEVMEIIISYETHELEENESNDLQMPGMDQWQSETDILLSGL